MVFLIVLSTTSPTSAPRRDSMRRILRPLVCLGTAALVGVLVAGCGGDDEAPVPDDAVAMVGDTKITKAAFERGMERVVGGGTDPRDRAACVAAKRTRARAEARADASAKLPTEAEFARECQKEYEELKSFIMDSLIKDLWARQEAKAQGIALTDREVGGFVEKARTDGFLTAEALRKAGVTERELLPQLLRNELRFKVARELSERASRVSEEEVTDYFRRNRNELIVKERRDLRLVVTPTRARADAARAAIEAGRSWKTVAREYSTHDDTRNKGGRISDLRETGQETGFAATIFRAQEGDLVGPLEEKGSWVLFVIERVQPAVQATLEQARDEITKHLRSTRSQRAMADFARRYRAKTTCAPEYKVPSCSNGPKPPPNTPPL
jgi:parvulin-like peptidyl-prolyl isomerase